jgi:hypothetical protein
MIILQTSMLSLVVVVLARRTKTQSQRLKNQPEVPTVTLRRFGTNAKKAMPIHRTADEFAATTADLILKY